MSGDFENVEEGEWEGNQERNGGSEAHNEETITCRDWLLGAGSSSGDCAFLMITTTRAGRRDLD
jgi:hypothetical protein